MTAETGTDGSRAMVRIGDQIKSTDCDSGVTQWNEPYGPRRYLSECLRSFVEFVGFWIHVRHISSDLVC